MSWSWSTRPQGKSKKMHLQPLYKFLSRKRLLSPNQKSEEASGITAFVMLNHSSMPHMAAHRLLCKGLWRRGENLRSRNPSPAVMTHCLYQTPAHSPSGITVNTAWAALYRARGKVDSRVLEGFCVSVLPLAHLNPEQDTQQTLKYILIALQTGQLGKTAVHLKGDQANIYT